MPALKIRLKLNEGRVGIPLEKLADIAKDTKTFLSMLGTDLHLSSEEWIANNFGNGSVMFDCQRIAVDAVSQKLGQMALRSVLSGDRETDISALIRPATRLQYGFIARHIDADEVIRIGLYDNGEAEPTAWYDLTRERAEQISEENARDAEYYGEVQGIVHAFFKEARRPRRRSSATGSHASEASSCASTSTPPSGARRAARGEPTCPSRPVPPPWAIRSSRGTSGSTT